MIIIKIIKLIYRLFNKLPDDKITSAIHNYYYSKKFVPNNTDHHRITVAIQSVEDSTYYGLFSAIISKLKQRRKVDVSVVIPRSINYIGNHAIARFYNNPLISNLISNQWLRLYAVFRPQIAYRSQALSDILPTTHKLRKSVDTIIAAAASGEVNIKDLQIQNIKVGDLVIDTYLRFKPSPYFKIDDPFVKKILIQTHRDVARSLRYFHRVKPHAYLTSYSVYLQHGIAVRAALSADVPVYSFGSKLRFSKKLTKADNFHTPNVNNYKLEFDQLPRNQKHEALKLANELMRDRINGKIDQATAYMGVSAYAAREEIDINLSGYVVIFLHDFYDSPHVWPDLLFDDFWSWATFTIEFLINHNIKFVIKPHPNQRAESKLDCEKLEKMYPDVEIISDKVSNKNLVDSGIACGVTVYGTVAHELAYLGVPSICCAQHPHHTFSFCRTAANVSEYQDLLKTYLKSPLPKKELSKQSLQFVYMHNFHGSTDAIMLRKAWVSYSKACTVRDTTAALESITTITRSKDFENLVNEICD